MFASNSVELTCRDMEVEIVTNIFRGRGSRLFRQLCYNSPLCPIHWCFFLWRVGGDGAFDIERVLVELVIVVWKYTIDDFLQMHRNVAAVWASKGVINSKNNEKYTRKSWWAFSSIGSSGVLLHPKLNWGLTPFVQNHAQREVGGGRAKQTKKTKVMLVEYQWGCRRTGKYCNISAMLFRWQGPASGLKSKKW